MKITPKAIKKDIQKRGEDFIKLVQEAERITGMTARAYLEYNKDGIFARIEIHPITTPKQNG